jgi:hypothetical protein
MGSVGPCRPEGRRRDLCPETALHSVFGVYFDFRCPLPSLYAPANARFRL